MIQAPSVSPFKRTHSSPLEDSPSLKRIRTSESGGSLEAVYNVDADSTRRERRSSTRQASILASIKSAVQTSKLRPVTTDIPHPVTGNYLVQTRCQSHRPKHPSFPQCMACISRQSASGGCKFFSLRAFPLDETTGTWTSFDKGMFLDSAPLQGKRQREAERRREIEYSTSGSIEDVHFIRSCITPTLEGVVSSELEFEKQFNERLVRRRREAGVRPVCDGCATTVFCGHFMCCACGREICLDCYYEWDDNLDKGHENVDSCSKRRRHTKRQMVPFTFAKEGELKELIKGVKSIQTEAPREQSEMNEFSKVSTEGFLSYVKTDISSIDENDFKTLWAHGQPLVITGCLPKFTISWTPEYFIQNYGEQKCLLVDCNTETHLQTTVGTFFQDFLTADPKRPLKLKVTPPLFR